MDVIRINRPFKCKMRLFKDSNREDEVLWYGVSKDALPFPFSHNFATGLWEDTRDKQVNTGVGWIDDQKLTYIKGHRNFPTNANCYTGNDDWYRSGVPLEALTWDEEKLKEHNCCPDELPVAVDVSVNSCITFSTCLEIPNQLQAHYCGDCCENNNTYELQWDGCAWSCDIQDPQVIYVHYCGDCCFNNYTFRLEWHKDGWICNLPYPNPLYAHICNDCCENNHIFQLTYNGTNWSCDVNETEGC